jgi:hypothetical protein
VAALDYWAGLPSSVHPDDPDKAFNYAVWWAYREASNYLHKRFDSNQDVCALVDEDEEDDYPLTIGPEGVSRVAVEPEVREPDPLADRLEAASDEELRAFVRSLESPE